ncbi:MAG TPA: sensor histidine kinase [Solirubrobacteraceae bacterium]|nr:sensor histidine kinase [Solirubrobacteraceae bacterium]
MLPLRRALTLIAAVGLIFAIGDVALILASHHQTEKAVSAVLGPIIGLSFIGTGAFAWLRRPHNRFGVLMVGVGFAWFVAGLVSANQPLLATVGAYVGPLYLVMVAQVIVSFPTGRAEGDWARVLIAAAYVDALLVRLPYFLLGGSLSEIAYVGGGLGLPEDRFAVAQRPDLAAVFQVLTSLIGVAILGGIVAVLVAKRRSSTVPQRRAQAPMLWTGLVLLATLAVTFMLDLLGAPRASQDAMAIVNLVAFAALPFAFLVGIVRTRYTRLGRVGELVERLAGVEARSSLRDALADALGDRALQLLYWRSQSETWVTIEGREVAPPEEGSGWSMTEVRAPGGEAGGNGEGVRIGAIVHDVALLDDPGLVRAVAGSAALAMENERLEAELRARVEELERSRARLLEISMFERRRLERDLHDGAQQRLVALSLQLGLARRKLQAAPDDAGTMLDAAREELLQALAELRELARGIHPAVLTDRGLGAALHVLADRTPVPVDVEQVPDERLPAPVEAAAYFVVAESLTNVARYAQASQASVRVARDDGYVAVEIQDDGVGGADLHKGTGLRGLADRLDALDGHLRIHSPPGWGTLVRADIPCASS